VLGAYAGRYLTTESDYFIVGNSRDNTNLAGDLANSLMVGVLAAAPATQTIAFNVGTGYFLANVGIGIATPTGYATRKLHIHDAAGTYAAIKLSHSGVGSTSDDGFDIGLSGSTAYFVHREGGAYNFLPKADTDIVFTFEGTTNSGVMKWMEDEDYFEFSDDIKMTDNETIVLGGTGFVDSPKYKAGGTEPVADGTYTVGIGGTTNGTITIKGGIITAVQEAVA
jgi:hypothetical protein